MTKFLIVSTSIAAIAAIALAAWQWADRRADRAVWTRLAAYQPLRPAAFDPSMVAALPEPAQRYFRYAISPGTPLYTVAEISMHGEFSLGTKAEPNYMPMQAEQILAAPHGFVWKVRAGNVVTVSGSDAAENGESWSRFRILGIVPVARAGGNADHARAAFGRYVAEAVFWTPAALLPGENVRWQALDNATVRVIVTHKELQQAVDLAVDSDGRLTRVVFQRWSDANAGKVYQLQPFGGYLSDYREFGGFRLPTRIDAGNFFETDDYFPFFRANVTSVRFPNESN